MRFLETSETTYQKRHSPEAWYRLITLHRKYRHLRVLSTKEIKIKS
jgi:hypothetical protein